MKRLESNDHDHDSNSKVLIVFSLSIPSSLNISISVRNQLSSLPSEFGLLTNLEAVSLSKYDLDRKECKL